MNLPPTDFGSATSVGTLPPGAGRAQFGQAAASAFSMKWAALHEAAGVVAMLAGLVPDAADARQRSFPAAMRDAADWRRDLAEKGIEDLNAVMEPGISALLAVHARGVDPGAPALALWQEFCAAREALLALAPPPGALGPMRRA